MHMLTKPQAFYDESHKTTLSYQNTLYLSQVQRKVPTLYDSHTIVKQHDPLSVPDTEETLGLAEESRLKMLAKQNDPSLKDKKVNIAPIDYMALNILFEEIPQAPSELVIKMEIPRELPRISLVKDSFNKIRDHVNNFDNVITVRTKHLICQDVLNVIMHANVHSHNVLPVNNNSLEHDNFASELLKHENDCLMEMLISQDLGHTVVNCLAAMNNYKNMEKMEQARELRPLDSDLDSACKFVTRIQELLVYVSATCPSLKHVSDKLVGVTPINKTREVRSKQFSEASGSKPRNNTKKDRITQTSSSNKKKNKVEDDPMIAKSSLNNMNRVSKPVCNAYVKHSVLNENSKLICANCHECMFDAIHDR
ncbi:hypothetical protein Tco_1452453, partial [Tanacetum coccineum]